MAETDALTSTTRTLYLVRVTTRNGSYSVGWDDPARVLKAVAEFHENGFGEVGVYDLQGGRIELAMIQGLANLKAAADDNCK